MIRALLIASVVAACALAAPFTSIDDIPAEYKGEQLPDGYGIREKY